MTVVVVGVDESGGARAALSWAIDQARAVGARLVLVHAYLPVSSYYPYTVMDGVYVGEGVEEEARRIAEEVVGELRRDVPDDVAAETVLAQGRPAEVLLDRGADADLLVVGSRGRGGFAGLLLGSVSQQVVQHAPCPVVVVPDDG